ncbi:MAG: PAS domain S-box protein, partial [Candidatus Competibacter sp.]|nr:PAS domain S-box protein [Candidatus Competibacter sp.]
LLTTLLTEQGYQVRPASSGALALRSVGIKIPDLILLDVRMPELDGYAVCQRLKADPRTGAIPVIFISALNEAADKIQGFAAGGVDYITKPFNPIEVLARVHTHLELRHMQQRLEQAQAELEQRVIVRTAELAHANRALHHSEERLRLVIEATRDGVWDWDLRTDELFCSDRWYTLLDYAPGAFPAGYAQWMERIHPEDRPAAEAAIQAHLADRAPQFNLEFRMRTPAGDWKWINGRGQVIERDAARRPLRMVGTHADISDRKRTEAALWESERKYRELVENANSIILRWNPQGKITFINEFGLRFFGYSAEELIGQHVVGTIVPLDETTGRDLRPLMDEICLHPERFERNVNENMRRNGERVWVSWTNKTVLDDQGQVMEVFSVGSDITDRKRAEEELQQHREHLEELVTERTAELRQAMAQIVQSEKLAALGSLVAGVAHELNTPLGNARVVASSLGEHLHEFAAAVESGALRRSQVDGFLSRGREAVELLERNTARAADLISQFKQVAVDQTSMRRRLFNLRQTVEEVLVTLRPQFKRTAHRIELDIPPELELDSYPGPLEQVLANLISNSLNHGFAGLKAGCIRLQAHAISPMQLALRYVDNGVGIPAATLNRIFEPFFTTRLGQGGSGLGLYIVYNLVRGVLGGAIQVESSSGQGASFTLTLPRTAPDQPVS